MKNEYSQCISTLSSALITGLLCVSLPLQASDIEIYQQAKAGDVTLMFVIDISGSMGYPQLQGPNDTSQCDLPSGSNYVSYSSENSINGSPVYKRYYCSATGNDKIYKYRSYRSGSRTYYDICRTPQALYNNCDWVDNGRNQPNLTTNGTESGGGYTYYYSSSVEKFYDRITRVKDGMFDLLNGNTTKSIDRLGDEKVIGLSAYSYNGNGKSGYILVPARRLDTVVSGKTQRAILLEKIAGFEARGGTPTANAYAEAASYLLGTTTAQTINLSGAPVYFVYGRYSLNCSSFSSNGTDCSQWQGYYYDQSIDTTGLNAKSCRVDGNNGTCYTRTGSYIPDSSVSGFPYSASETKNATSYIRPTSIDSQVNDPQGQQCSGQGIYVLTDGEPNNNNSAEEIMKKALSTKGGAFSCSNSDSGWDCINKFNIALLNKGNNPVELKFKTAVVGFGNAFNSISSFNKNLTQAQNIANIDATSANSNIKNAAKWGVYGEGGWYSGSNSDDVVNSVNNFINSLSTEIPAVTTGTSTIPVDALNPIAVQPYSYYPQFQPTPDKTYQVWFGNVKKYKVLNGVLKDRDNKRITNKDGKLLSDTNDLWAKILDDNSTSEDKDLALKGGALNKIPLRYDVKTSQQRKLLVNRKIIDPNTGASITDTQLMQVTKDYITDLKTKNDPDRGYLMTLLGYRVNAEQPTTITEQSLQKAEEIRQIGGVMHSSPLLLTQKGRINITNDIITSTNREDYVLFGSNQGLLHIVNAETGVEKFAFVPNEMINNQKSAFLEKTTTSGGLNKMYYGIDGPWTAYTYYVPTGTEGYLTVGSGKASSKGKQWVYGGLRMGGRSYYALDLTDINDPKLKFQIDPDNAIASSPLRFMGQSWSKPTITFVNWKGKRRQVMIVGGGYDAGGSTGNGVNGEYRGYEYEDYDQNTTNSKSSGNNSAIRIGAGVYMFDADTGELLWWTSSNVSTDVNSITGVNAKAETNLKYSVTSRVNAVDRNADGLTDHLYFGDLGGQVWRIDLDNTAEGTIPFAKRVTRLLNLNLGTSGKSPRFYDAPTFTVYNDAEFGRFGLINIGSGNRSKPLAEYSGTETSSGRYFDAIYAIYDKDVTNSNLYTTTTNMITRDLTRNNLTEVVNRSTRIAYDKTNGWYYKFQKGNKIQSEKVMGELIALNKNLYVGVFDGSKPGQSGDCGAGVKGESTVQRFCLPYSDCSTNPVDPSTKDEDNVLSMGAGIVGPVIGSACTTEECIQNGGTDKITGNALGIVSNCEGDDCGGGSVKALIQPSQRLIPIRWYEEYANPKKIGS